MKRWLGESLRTLSVTTFHPVGWGVHRLWNEVRGQRRRAKQRTRPPEPPHERSYPVLLVHGVFHNSTAFYRLERKLQKRGFDSLDTIELWTSFDSLETMIDQLKTKVRAMHDSLIEHGLPGKVRLIGHSLGGMVVRAALLDPEFAASVDKVVFLGTPHQGHPFYRLPLPRCFKSLSHNGTVMRQLRSEPLPPGIGYWNLRGGMLDVVTPPAFTFLPHVNNLTFQHVGHAGLLNDRHVVQSIMSILEGASC